MWLLVTAIVWAEAFYALPGAGLTTSRTLCEAAGQLWSEAVEQAPPHPIMGEPTMIRWSCHPVLTGEGEVI